MKKTIAIHINKSIFQIDEDAYQKLEDYLGKIKTYYGSGEEGKEILSDIEAGIAEKFNELLTNKNQSLSNEEVDRIIKIMGTVEEIINEEKNKDTIGTETLENDEKNKITASRRLYRNPDDVVIAGICSGLAAYFGVDPVYVRLLFVVGIFFNGISIITYVILWMVMPLAKTGAQKLEMQGEPVNLKKIEEAVKEKTKIIAKESSAALKKITPENSSVKKIISLPIKLIGNTFFVIKKIFLIVIPLTSIIIGVTFVLGTIFSMVGITVALFAIFFNITSSYITTDIPLEIFTSSPLYYSGILSIYLIILLPIILFFILGISMIRRKNTFNVIFIGLIIGIWAISLALGLSFVAEVSPRVYQEIQEQQNQVNISKDYDYKDWKKLYLSGNIEATIKKGDEFKITANSQEKNLNQINFKNEDGQLQIAQYAIDDKKFCIFCNNKKINMTITVPELESVVSIKNSKIKIKDFDKDIYLSLGESSQVEIEVAGQNITCLLSGIFSCLTLTGTANEINCEMNGRASLLIDKINANKITLKQDILSYSKLSGNVKELTANLHHKAELDAEQLIAENIIINTYDYSTAELGENINTNFKEE